MERSSPNFTRKSCEAFEACGVSSYHFCPQEKEKNSPWCVRPYYVTKATVPIPGEEPRALPEALLLPGQRAPHLDSLRCTSVEFVQPGDAVPQPDWGRAMEKTGSRKLSTILMANAVGYSRLVVGRGHQIWVARRMSPVIVLSNRHVPSRDENVY